MLWSFGIYIFIIIIVLPPFASPVTAESNLSLFLPAIINGTQQAAQENGNPDGFCPVPPEAQPIDTSSPDHVIGDGTPQSCTSAAVVAAVALGGVITFNCGPSPVTIVISVQL